MVREGFKQTEIGVIPEDWDVKEIGEITTKLIGGGTPSRGVKEFWNGNLPWMTVKDFASFNPLFTQEYITDLGLRNSATRIVSAGELIIATRIALGQIVKYSVDVTINQDLKTIQLDKKIDTDYFIYFYKSISKKIIEKGSGSTVLGLSIDDLKSFQIPLPPLPEQKAIAEALSDTDAWIESLEQLIAKKRLIKQGAMQELLRPKEGWEVRRLGEVLQFGSGKDYKHLGKGEIPVYGTGGLMTLVNDYLYEGESVGIGRKGTIDSPIFLQGKFWTVDTLFYTHSFVGTIPKFIFYSFLQIPWKEYNEASGVPSLNKKTLEQIEISFPPLSEQISISAILSDMDTEIERLENQLIKARQIKQGMMQDLLTGRTRLVKQETILYEQ